MRIASNSSEILVGKCQFILQLAAIDMIAASHDLWKSICFQRIKRPWHD